MVVGGGNGWRTNKMQLHPMGLVQPTPTRWMYLCTWRHLPHRIQFAPSTTSKTMSSRSASKRQLWTVSARSHYLAARYARKSGTFYQTTRCHRKENIMTRCTELCREKQRIHHDVLLKYLRATNGLTPQFFRTGLRQYPVLTVCPATK